MRPSGGLAACIAGVMISGLIVVINAQANAPLPPMASIPPAPATSTLNAICDVQQVPYFYDSLTCGLSNWVGSSTVLTPGTFAGTTYINLEATRLTALNITLTGFTTRFYNPVAPILPTWVVVGSGICDSLSAAVACLATVNASVGATSSFNASACSGCLASSLAMTVQRYSYQGSSSVFSNSTSRSVNFTRDLNTGSWTAPSDPTWTMSSGQIFVFAGSLSFNLMQYNGTATATLTARNPSPLPPASPGSFDMGAASLHWTLLHAMFAIATCIILGRI